MKKWSADRWMSLAAIVASLGTLFVIVYQTSIFRKQQYASVLPYLEIWNSNSTDRYQLILVNNGIGPAFIEKVTILYKDSVYQMEPAVFLQKVILLEDTIRNVGHSNINKGRIIPAGEKIDLLAVRNDTINSKKLRYWFNGGSASREDFPEIEIEYASVYGERWMIQKYGTEVPVSLNH